MKGFIELFVTDGTTEGVNSYLFGIDEMEKILNFIEILETHSRLLSYEICKSIG